MDAHEDVELVVQTSVVVLVEDLEPDEHVEDDGAPFVLGIAEELGPGEVDDECCGDLQYLLALNWYSHGTCKI